MKKYDKYKDSGVEWIGEIPEHWEVKRLKYVVSLNDETLSEKTDEETQLDYIEIGDLKNGSVGSTKYSFGNAPSRARRIVRSGDVIVSTVRTYLKAIAQISDDKDGYIASTGFAILRPIKINSKFLGYYSNSPFFIDRTIAYSVGVTYPAINAFEILLFPIQIPSPHEQTAIANYLDRKTKEIDELIADKKRLLELYEEEKTAIINQAVTKGLNPDAPMKDSGIEWLGEIPAHWEVKKLKYVIDVHSGEGLKSSEINRSGTFPIYGGNGIVGYTKKYNADHKTIIIGRVGAKCGNIHLVSGKIWISDNALSANIISNVTSEFLANFLTNMNLNKIANQNAQPLITSTMVKEQLIAFPSKNSEQSEIVKFIEDSLNRIKVKIDQVNTLIELLTEYRTALISEVVTGKIKVTD